MKRDNQTANDLEQLLERTTLEPAFGPAFFACLLASQVYVLVPSGEVITDRETIRFVMWTGANRRPVIPFFSRASLAEQTLLPQFQVIRIDCVAFFRLSRGATVVLNPNERFNCKLEASEVELLLATGAPDAAEAYVSGSSQQVELRTPSNVPADLLHSLALLFAQCAEIERAFLLTMPGEPPVSPEVWLVAVIVDSDDAENWVSRQLSSLLASRPPSHDVDLMRLTRDSSFCQDVELHVKPFYDRAFGSRVVLDVASQLQ